MTALLLDVNVSEWCRALLPVIYFVIVAAVYLSISSAFGRAKIKSLNVKALCSGLNDRIVLRRVPTSSKSVAVE